MRHKLPHPTVIAVLCLTVWTLQVQQVSAAQDTDNTEDKAGEPADETTQPASGTEATDDGKASETADPEQPQAATVEAQPEATEKQEEAQAATESEESNLLGREAAVARIFSGGRVAGGVLLPGGQEVVTLLSKVRLGTPIEVRLGSGHSTKATIVATDRSLDLAILALETHAEPRAARTLSETAPEVGDEVQIIGHGGSSRNDESSLAVGGLASFSSLWARVSAAQDETAATGSPSFLLDRSAGDEDLGAPVFNTQGEVVGMISELLEDSGGRALVLSSVLLDSFAAAERDPRPYLRPHHLQSWGGFGVASHNRPSHIAGLITLGLRGVFLDRLRIEPWFEVDLGTRAPVTNELTGVQTRPREFWWSLETGLHVGYRVPLFGEGGRNYFVPHVGFRLGWNRFQHAVEEISSLCGKSWLNCSHSLERSVDQERSFRAGFELGADLRHGAMRIGYRIFLDPTNLQAHTMHRLVLTFDGVPIPIRVGDSN